MTVSIIMINWNGLRFLNGFFETLGKQKQSNYTFEIIMVDNNSADESVAFVEKNYPSVRVVRHHNNSGFAEGANIGMKHATGDYLVLINNDMELDRQWLYQLVKTAESSDEKVGAVVSKVMFKNKPGYINNAGSVLDAASDWPVKDRGFMEKDMGQYDNEEAVSAFCGASVLLKRTMLRDIGIFDQAFFMYFEDADLSWRGAKAGWKYLYQPKSVTFHEHTGSSKEGSDFFVFQVARNRMLILLKQGKFKTFYVVLSQTFHERITAPLRTIVLHSASRRSALHDLKLGLRIFWSFLLRAPAAFLKRSGLLRERRLT